ncbi:hypothetical protein F4703DRAFT_1730082, partial [Phycomyces blakesleeanus]
NDNNDVLFSNIIRPDGFGLDCPPPPFFFYKINTTIKDPVHSLQLKLSYFNYQEVEQEYMPVFIDPGRSSVFATACALSTQKHALTCWSTKEY